jgi:putative protein kinase ArgK-like GTPase of G3E family
MSDYINTDDALEKTEELIEDVEIAIVMVWQRDHSLEDARHLVEYLTKFALHPSAPQWQPDLVQLIAQTNEEIVCVEGLIEDVREKVEALHEKREKALKAEKAREAAKGRRLNAYFSEILAPALQAHEKQIRALQSTCFSGGESQQVDAGKHEISGSSHFNRG